MPLAELRPNDPQAQNNRAQLALLLEVYTMGAAQIARDLHAKEPANPVFASTYAFLLYALHRYPDAVAVLNNLAPQQKPEIAIYYGILLAAAGERERAI